MNTGDKNKKGRPLVKKIEMRCDYCGKEYLIYPAHVRAKQKRRDKHSYCSIECKRRARIGIQTPEEVRLKISKKVKEFFANSGASHLKGKKLSEKIKKKMSKSHKGLPSSMGMLGKHHSEGAKEKMRGSRPQMSRENNPNWQGGISSERNIFYSSLEWARVIPIIWKRDGKTCQRCKKKYAKGDQFHIHHKTSFRVKELRAKLWNLLLLCEECHRWVHSRKNINKEFLD